MKQTFFFASHHCQQRNSQATDEFSISRETAIIALSYCDRYLMTKKITRHLFQVVAVCSLFFASKLFEKRHIPMSALMNYTQGKFNRAELLSIEKELVISLASFSYPPIASTFCLMFLSKFPSTIQSSMPAVADTCQFMIELAACDSFFIAHKQSRIALAAAVVAMEQMNMPTELLQALLSNIKSTGINFDLATNACLKQLRSIYNHNQMRIQALDGGITTIAAANSSQNDRKRVCRAATPSPTPEDQPELKDVIASGGTKFSSIADDCIDGDCNQRDNKRQRYEA